MARPSVRDWRTVLVVLVVLVTGAAMVSSLLLSSSLGADESSDPPAKSPGSPSRPNIVLITTDDMTAADIIAMPRVRRLIGAHGATFDNSFAPHPLCCPARASILTGQYSHNHGVLTNAPKLGGGFDAFDDRSTLATWMQEAGYRTGFTGKYFNGYADDERHYVPPGWDDWKSAFAPSAYSYFNTKLNENGKVKRYPGRYSSFLYADKTREFIDESVRLGERFFYWTSFVAPHNGGPRDVDDPRHDSSKAPGTPSMPDAYRDLFADLPLPDPPSFNESDVSDKPAYVARNAEPLSEAKIGWYTELYQQRLESLAATDVAVGRIIDRLREHRLLDKTLIIFTSDNGWLYGEHRMGGKLKPYEPSIRVPLLMRGPGIAPRLDMPQFAGTHDLAPTIIDAAGGRAGLRMDGMSLLPLLDDPTQDPRRTLVLEGGSATRYSTLRWVGLRTPRWTYVEYRSGARELYDLRNDPHQLNSLHKVRKYAGVEKRLAKRLDALGDCAGQECRPSR